MSAPEICIVTPAWNRAQQLERLGRSLAEQTDKEFTWLIADDASVDDTRDLVCTFQSKFQLQIQYIRLETNAGKGAALNRAFDSATASLLAIVDSDDVLLPSGVADIRESARRYSGTRQIGALFFRYQMPQGEVIGPRLPAADRIISRAENDSGVGKYDGCIAYYARALQGRRNPEYPGETYIGETVLQMELHPNYKIAFINRVVGIANYQETGLTAAGRSLRLRNPKGMLHYAELRRSQACTCKDKVISEVRYQAYARAAKEPIRDLSLWKLLLSPLAWLALRIWQRQAKRVKI